MNILLHICCGPCLIYPFSRLKDKGFKISGFYYNPNIHPVSEYSRREEALKLLNQEFSLEIEYSEHKESDFSQAINTQENPAAPRRCIICWSLRLRKTAQQAKQNGFTVFSTTLLVSPYQNHELLKKIGRQISRETGIDFYYEDFRPGFKQAQLEARSKGIYRQKYCGCKYSMRPQLTGAVAA
jgi:predicted adenine nucleotide alpha hydrolase (AANH) superfamily ATPase